MYPVLRRLQQSPAPAGDSKGLQDKGRASHSRDPRASTPGPARPTGMARARVDGRSGALVPSCDPLPGEARRLESRGVRPPSRPAGGVSSAWRPSCPGRPGLCAPRPDARCPFLPAARAALPSANAARAARPLRCAPGAGPLPARAALRSRLLRSSASRSSSATSPLAGSFEGGRRDAGKRGAGELGQEGRGARAAGGGGAAAQEPAHPGRGLPEPPGPYPGPPPLRPASFSLAACLLPRCLLTAPAPAGSPLSLNPSPLLFFPFFPLSSHVPLPILPSPFPFLFLCLSSPHSLSKPPSSAWPAPFSPSSSHFLLLLQSVDLYPVLAWG